MQTRERLSNFELLRIIAMFMILLIHANYFSLGIPTAEDLQKDTLPTLLRFFGQSLCTGAVDTFVLISGWFGIRASLKGGCKLLFQCFFIMILVYFACILLGKASFNVKGIKACFMMNKDIWFIKAYLGLYLLSPFLNAYLEKATNRQLISFLLAFYLFQSLYGWITDAAAFIKTGYSVFSFIGLYVLAHACRRNIDKLQKHQGYVYGISYLMIILLITTIATIGAYKGTNFWGALFMKYTSPFVILSSMVLVYWFSTFSIRSKTINTIAVSSLSIYLIHMHSCVKDIYRNEIRLIWLSYPHLTSILIILAFCMGVFVFCVLVDRIRIICWGFLKNRINKTSLSK